MQNEIIEIIEKEYDIGTVLKVHEILTGTTNHSYRVLVDRRGCRRKYILRKYTRGTTGEKIRFEAALINHATENGMRICAKLVVSRAGEFFVIPPKSKDVFAVSEYLEGEDKFKWNNPNLTNIELANAGAVLAEFHHSVRSFDSTLTRIGRNEPSIEKLAPQFLVKLKAFCEHQRSGELIPCLAKNLKRIELSIEKSTLTPVQTKAMPMIPIHCDFHPGNLKWRRQEVVGLFDFDWAKIDLRLFDVCMALIYFCSIWEGPCAGELHLDKCVLFLNSYEKRLHQRKGLKPLTLPEHKALPKMLAMANIYLLFWVIVTYIENEQASDTEYLAYLKHCLRLMQWISDYQHAIVASIPKPSK